MNLILLHDQKERYENDYDERYWDVALSMADEEEKSKAHRTMSEKLEQYRRDFYADVDEEDNGRLNRQHTA